MFSRIDSESETLLSGCLEAVMFPCVANDTDKFAFRVFGSLL